MPDADTPLDASPTAGGRSAWIVIGIVGLVLVGILALTSFFGDDGTGTAAATSDATQGTSSPTDGSGAPSGASGASGATGSCSASVAEPLDPTAAIRLLPNAEEPTYATDPPTSGAFVVGASASATPTEPLSRPVQVGLLARGKVLIQYNSTVSAGDATDLQGLAGDDVIVAPNPTMASPIVATAWRVRQTCDQLDLLGLREFATVNANRAPDADASTTTTAG